MPHPDREDDGERRILSPQQLAVRYGITVRTLTNWRTAGTGPRWFRLGRLIRYRLSDVEHYEAEHFTEPTKRGQK